MPDSDLSRWVLFVFEEGSNRYDSKTQTTVKREFFKCRETYGGDYITYVFLGLMLMQYPCHVINHILTNKQCTRIYITQVYIHVKGILEKKLPTKKRTNESSLGFARV